MTSFDFGVIAVLALSLILGALRGFVREAFALVGWIGAFVLAITFAKPVAQRFFGFVDPPELAPALAFAAIGLGTLLAAGLTGLLLARLLRAAGLGLSDRVLGTVFGAARGLLVVLALVLLGGLTMLPREPFWRDAQLAPPLETAVIAMKPYLPPALAQKIRYR
jgi:membrane protein required for colicin V production